MKNFLLKTVTVIIAVMILFISGCADKKKYGNGNLTKNYFENNIDEVLSRCIDFTEIFGNGNPFNVLFTGNETFNITFDAEIKPFPEKYGHFTFETNIDRENKCGSVNINLNGLSPRNADFMVYADDEKLLFSSDVFFGEETVYSLVFRDFDRLKAEFSESSLAKILGVTENEVYELCEEYGINKEYLKKVVHTAKEYEYFFEDFFDNEREQIGRIFDKCLGEITEDTIEVNGYKSDALVLNVKIYDGFISELINEYIKGYRSYIGKQCEFFEEVIPEKLKDDLNIDIGAVKDELTGNAGNILVPFAHQADFTADLKLYLDKTDGKLRKINCEKDGYFITLYFADEISIEYSDGDKTLTSGKIYHTENSNTKTYGFKIASSDNSYESIEGAFEIIKFENRFNLFIRIMNGSEIAASVFESEGRFMYSENSVEISPEYIMSGDAKSYPGITLGVSSDTYIMEYEKHKSIFELSEKEILGICDRASEIFAEISANSKGYSYNELYLDDGFYDGELSLD